MQKGSSLFLASAFGVCLAHLGKVKRSKGRLWASELVVLGFCSLGCKKPSGLQAIQTPNKVWLCPFNTTPKRVPLKNHTPPLQNRIEPLGNCAPNSPLISKTPSGRASPGMAPSEVHDKAGKLATSEWWRLSGLRMFAALPPDPYELQRRRTNLAGAGRGGEGRGGKKREGEWRAG